jgi:hypothetical protein
MAFTPPDEGLTGSCRTIVPCGMARDPPVWLASGVGADGRAGGVIPATRNATLPKVTTSFAPASAWVMRAPFRKVPFEEPRSFTRTPPATSAISAWRREIVGS